MSRAAAPRALWVERVVRSAFNETVRTRKTNSARWAGAAEAAFLEALAETCNVKRAAAAAGFSTEACYQQRMRRPAFAADWARALALGYERLEDVLIERTLAEWETGTERGTDAGRGTPAARRPGRGRCTGIGDGARANCEVFSTAVILTLLRVHRTAARGRETEPREACDRV